MSVTNGNIMASTCSENGGTQITCHKLAAHQLTVAKRFILCTRSHNALITSSLWEVFFLPFFFFFFFFLLHFPTIMCFHQQKARKQACPVMWVSHLKAPATPHVQQSSHIWSDVHRHSSNGAREKGENGRR